MKTAIITMYLTLLFLAGGCQPEPDGNDFYIDAGIAAIEKIAAENPEKAFELIRAQEAAKAIQAARIESSKKMRGMFTWAAVLLFAASVFIAWNRDISQAIGCVIGSLMAASFVVIPDSYYQWIFIGLVALLAVWMFIHSGRTPGGIFSFNKDERVNGNN